MRRLYFTAVALLLLFGCDSYLEERLGFLELPFEYEGEFPGREYNLAWDLAWGVPDNGDRAGVYLGNQWGDIFYTRDDRLWYLGWLNAPRPVASLHGYEWLVSVDGSGGGETLRLYRADLTSKSLPGETDTNLTGVAAGESMLAVDGLFCYYGNVESDFQIGVDEADTVNSQFNGPSNVLPAGSVTLAAVLAEAFPEADGTWGPPTVGFQAFAPASLASWEGDHKFIVSRGDGLTGRQKTVLVSIYKDPPYTMTTREISAQSDFHFVSRDRFVGMDGDTLRIFDSGGELLQSHTLEGMKLLGYRSAVDPELVFLYSSDEDDGERVWGIYTLPASFIREAQ